MKFTKVVFVGVIAIYVVGCASIIILSVIEYLSKMTIYIKTN